MVLGLSAGDLTYIMILAASGLFGAPILSGAIYYDAGRRGLSPSRRRLLIALFGLSSFGGFLVPYLLMDQLGYFYFRVLKPRAITVHPLEWVVVSIATGVLISLCLGLSYLIGTRFGWGSAEP